MPGDNLDKSWTVFCQREDSRWDAWLLSRANSLRPWRPAGQVAVESLGAMAIPLRMGLLVTHWVSFLELPHKDPKLGRGELKTNKCILSHCWRADTEVTVLAGWVPFQRPSQLPGSSATFGVPWLVDAPLQALPPPPCMCLCPNVPLLTRTQVRLNLGLSLIYSELILTSSHLQRPHFPKRSHSQVPRVRT